ncbi:MAG: GxxExxY protein [Panacibacter sp.]
MDRERYNYLSGQILDSCIEVHRILGPGLLESIYQYALITELTLREINAVQRIAVPLFYKGHDTGKVYEIDIIVENEIVLELKAAEALIPLFDAQLISYLKLSGKRLGFLINFNVPLLKDGLKRFVNNF